MNNYIFEKVEVNSERWFDLTPLLNEKFKKSVLQFDVKGKFLNEYDSIIEASIKTKCNKSIISKCCHNIIKKPKMFLWKFKESESDKYGKFNTNKFK